MHQNDIHGTEKWFRYVRIGIHWMITIVILVFVIASMVGFVLRWFPMLLHPADIATNYHSIIADLFTVLLMYELMALSRVISPKHLLDLVLTVIAREMMLSTNQSNLLIFVISFVLLLLVRLVWNRFSKVEEVED